MTLALQRHGWAQLTPEAELLAVSDVDCDPGRLYEDNSKALRRNTGRALLSSITDAAPASMSWMDLIINIYWVIITTLGPKKAVKQNHVQINKFRGLRIR